MELRPGSGRTARDVAVRALTEVLDRHQPLDDAFERALKSAGKDLEPRDRGFARLLVTTALRRLGEIDERLETLIARPLPADAVRVRSILQITAAQLIFLATPAHAAVDSAVSLTRAESRHERFSGLVNAVSRRLAQGSGDTAASRRQGRRNTPDWLWRRWVSTYGESTAAKIAEAHLHEPALDLSVKGDAGLWAERLGADVLGGGGLRLRAHGRIEELSGFAEGAWWVQDAAAALPAQLLGDIAGREVLDLCAAPGGKTAQLVASGARVIAVDSSRRRLGILRRNLDRLSLTAEVIEADVRSWSPGRRFERVLLDAPCLATGTIRRHPDLPYLKSEAGLEALLLRQRELLDRAVDLLAPGGVLVYATCSLEPEEGEGQIEVGLARHSGMRVVGIQSGEAGIQPEWITDLGYLRTLPFHSPGNGPNVAGMDGFFAARLIKAAR
ncbi:MAG: transcription antitermination factor NusB [Hyphomicrobiaceae bacterium]